MDETAAPGYPGAAFMDENAAPGHPGAAFPSIAASRDGIKRRV